MQTRLRSFVAQRLLQTSTDVIAGPTDAQKTVEDGIVFDYLRRSRCNYTLPVFVAERPWSTTADMLSELGALTSRVQQLGTSESQASDGNFKFSVLRRLLDVVSSACKNVGAEGVQQLAAASDIPTTSLALRLADAELRHGGASEIAELRANFAARMCDYQRSVDLRADEEVQVCAWACSRTARS